MNSSRIVQQLMVSAVIVLALAGCGGASDAPTVTSTPVPPTPTATSIPPTPTATSIPPTPTATPIPPTPTASSIPPTPTAEPILTGLIDVGGFRLYIDCIGDGSPTVVLDSSLGEGRYAWSAVLALVENDPPTRICVYDRRGLGQSSTLPREPRSSLLMVRELRALLDAAYIPGPYILAGHFATGLNAWLFASQYPDDVAGVIMVDSLHPDYFTRINEAMEPFLDGEYAEMAQQWVGSPADYRNQPEYWAQESTNQQVTDAGPFGDIPLVVLTRDTNNIEVQLGLWRRYLAPDVPAELVEAYDEVWLSMQEELTELSTNSVHIIVENSTLFIPRERPDAVVDAILTVMEMAETNAPQ